MTRKQFHWGEPPCDQFEGKVTFDWSETYKPDEVNVQLAGDDPSGPDAHLDFQDFNVPREALLAYADHVRGKPDIRSLFRWSDEDVVDPRMVLAISDPAELAKLIQSPAWGIYTFPLLKPEWCAKLIWFADQMGDYKPDPSDPYPGRELRTSEVAPLHRVMDDLLQRYISPLSEACFGGFSLNRVEDSFVLRYCLETQQEMGCHFDDLSDVSLTVVLNDEFEGGGLYFPEYEWSSAGLEPGMGVMFPGRVTHRHQGLKITAGERYALVIWTSGRDQ